MNRQPFRRTRSGEPSDLDDVVKDPQAEISRCYTAALRLLSYRFRSIAELKSRLEEKGFDAATIDETLQRLERENWLDDERFAVEFTRGRLRKRIGPNRIRRELKEFGIEDAMIRAVLTEAGEDENQEDHLLAAARKKARILARRHGPEFLESDEGRRKLTLFLLSQGYDYPAVAEVLKKEYWKN